MTKRLASDGDEKKRRLMVQLVDGLAQLNLQLRALTVHVGLVDKATRKAFPKEPEKLAKK